MEHNKEHIHSEHNYKKDILSVGYIIGASVIVGSVLIASTLFYTFKLSTGSTVVTDPNAVGSDAVAKIELKSDAPYLGNKNAKVVVVEYADYQCSFCKKFYSEVMPTLKSKYIDTNKIKFVYQDFAFLGPNSLTAAAATHCAEDQGKFWQYHDYLYNNQGVGGAEWASAANQKKYAQVLGLNTTQFNSCLDSGKYDQRVKDESMAGSKYGVKGTPTVFINGKPLVGALPVEEFVAAIDEALK